MVSLNKAKSRKNISSCYLTSQIRIQRKNKEKFKYYVVIQEVEMTKLKINLKFSDIFTENKHSLPMSM